MKIVGQISILLTVLLVVSSPVKAQTSSGSHSAGKVSIAELHKYLREPNGLERLSEKIGDIELSDPDEIWGQDDIASMTKRSDVILIASIAGKTSHLTDDGDSIVSKYDLNAEEILKGEGLATESFIVRGGTVVLSNNHTATVHSDLSDDLSVGDKYILFLKKEDGSLVPLPGSQGALRVNAKKNVELLTNQPNRDSKLAADLNGLSSAAVKDKIFGSIK